MKKKKKWLFVVVLMIVMGGLFVYGRTKAKEVEALMAQLSALEKYSNQNGSDYGAKTGSSDLDVDALLGILGGSDSSKSDSSDLDVNALLGLLGEANSGEKDDSDRDALLEALGNLTAKEEENSNNLEAILGALNQLNSNALTEEGLENMINEFLWGESEEELQIVQGELSAEFKQTMDSYEAICDESIAFMKKVENADESSMMSLYSEMTGFIERLTAIQEQVETLGKGPMTTGEYEYYQEVMEHISQKKENMSFDLF